MEHEVRRPVANILGITQLLSESVNEEERKHYITKLQQSTVELDDMIKTIVRKAGAVRSS